MIDGKGGIKYSYYNNKGMWAFGDGTGYSSPHEEYPLFIDKNHGWYKYAVCISNTKTILLIMELRMEWLHE